MLKKIWGSAQGMDSMLKYLQRKIDEFWTAGPPPSRPPGSPGARWEAGLGDSQAIYCQGVFKYCNFKINNYKTPLSKRHSFILNTHTKCRSIKVSSGLLFEALNSLLSSASTV